MTPIRYLQIDVFAEKPGGGNPLGVVFGADAWSAAQMQAFAAWTNLVETTYVLAPTRAEASYRLRIFTPHKEIPYAGHPTVGSAHAALETARAVARNGLLLQECGAGLLPIRVEAEHAARRIFVQAPASKVLRTGADDFGLRAVLGSIPLGALLPAFVEGGRRWWIAEFAHEADLRAWHPDHVAIAALARASDSLGLCVFARAQRNASVTHEGDYNLVVRAFPAGVGIIEDPASGAANGLIAAYIAQAESQGALAHGYRVSQGREIGRDATLDIRIETPAGAAAPTIWVGGRAHTIVDGAVRAAIG